MLQTPPAGRRALRLAVLLLGVAVLSVVPLPVFSFVPEAAALTTGLDHLQRFDSSVSDGVARAIVGEHQVDPFTLIALTFSESPSSQARVRVHDAAGWGAWRTLELEEAEAPDGGSPEVAAAGSGRPAFGTEPYFVGTGDGYEIDLAESDLARANVVLVRESLKRTVADATPLADAVTIAFPGLHTRAEWGAAPPVEAPALASEVVLAVVHHADSSNAYTPAQVPSAIRSIQTYHMQGRGWNDIAYNFVVDKYGGIWEGRGGGVDEAVIGAHAAGFNTRSVGVMVLGAYSSTAPSAAAVESVSRVIGWKFAHYGISATGSVTYTSGGSPKYPAGTEVTIPRVVGHGDVGSTDCPGLIRNSLPAIRNRAQEWMTWYRTQLAPIGELEAITAGAGTVTVKGWAIDQLATGAAKVRIQVGTKVTDIVANKARPDIAAVHPDYPAAGYSATITGVRPGAQNVCATALGSLSGGTDAVLGCGAIYVTDPLGVSPIGGIAAVTAGKGYVYAAGWALDPETTATVNVSITIDGAVRATMPAAGATSDMPPHYAKYWGTNRAFVSTVKGVTAGKHRVCAQVDNLGAGYDVVLGCYDVFVIGTLPEGYLDSVVPGTGSVTVAGWALDRETVDPISLSVSVDGAPLTIVADKPRSDIAALYSGYGPNHGFSGTVTAAKGKRRVCVTALNVGDGVNVSLGCRDVVVK